MFISIVIPCRNEARFIDQCIESVVAQRLERADFEVLVADGLSDDGTRERVKHWMDREPRVRLIDNPKRIVSSGLNEAIRHARGDVIVRMDVHTEYAEDYVQQCLVAMAETGAENVGGPARTKSRSFVQTAVALAYHSKFSVGGARFHEPEYSGYVDTVTYGCWPRRLFDEIGFFDEELVRNQDDEFNLRIRRAGGRVWQSAKIRSWYYPRASLSALFKQYMQYGYWKVRVIRKHRFPASIRQLVPGLFIGTVAALAAASLASNAARFVLGVVLVAYLTFAIAASAWICRKRDNWRYTWIMPAVLAAYHLGYGTGFVFGLVDFIVLNGKAKAVFSKLTR